MAVLDILDCTMEDLIEPVAAGRREDQGGRCGLGGRGRRAPPEAGADRARRAMTALANPVLDPVGVVVGLVTAADPALGEQTARRAAEQAAGGRAKRRRLAAALARDHRCWSRALAGTAGGR